MGALHLSGFVAAARPAWGEADALASDGAASGRAFASPGRRVAGVPWSSPSSGFGLIRCGGVKGRVRVTGRRVPGGSLAGGAVVPGRLTPARALGGTAGGVGARVTWGCALRFPVDVSTVARARGTVQASRPMFSG